MKKVSLGKRTTFSPSCNQKRQNNNKSQNCFGASASPNGSNIKSCFYKGQQLTPLIFDILLRFRSHFVAVVRDIEKAFRQISIIPKHKKFEISLG